jgi:hypothetical protein
MLRKPHRTAGAGVIQRVGAVGYVRVPVGIFIIRLTDLGVRTKDDVIAYVVVHRVLLPEVRIPHHRSALDAVTALHVGALAQRGLPALPDRHPLVFALRLVAATAITSGAIDGPRKVSEIS